MIQRLFYDYKMDINRLSVKLKDSFNELVIEKGLDRIMSYIEDEKENSKELMKIKESIKDKDKDSYSNKRFKQNDKLNDIYMKFLNIEINKYLEFPSNILDKKWYGSSFMYIYTTFIQNSLKSNCEPFFFAIESSNKDIYGKPKYRGNNKFIKRINLSFDLDHLLQAAVKFLYENRNIGPGQY